jgi:putative Mn2+ efflux pump MntP
MTVFSILLIGIALSFDVMAVSTANGASNHKMSFAKAFQIAFFFGLFHFLMPLLGWLAGINLEPIVSRFDHIIAFVLLFILGLKMVVEAFKKEENKDTDIHNLKNLLLMSLAISIDALVIGMTFALLPVNILLASSIIGLTAFTISILSVYVGKMFGKSLGKKAEVMGGLILIIIGIKILINHLFF